jgi:hypothetical protein
MNESKREIQRLCALHDLLCMLFVKAEVREVIQALTSPSVVLGIAFDVDY